MAERIILHVNSLSETGTSTSIFEYALGLKKKQYTLTIAFDREAKDNNLKVEKIFQSYFEIYPYKRFSDLNQYVKRNFDMGYFLKAGAIDGKVFSKIPNAIHAVFKHFEPHGQKYAYVSEWLRDQAEIERKKQNTIDKLKILYKGGRLYFDEELEFVPHCVELPTQNAKLRKEWGIPEDAILGIRIGGREKFDIGWVQETVLDVVQKQPNLFFVFINTNKFADHPRIKFVPAIIDLQNKVNALTSADFFIHARMMGESFGMAILEAMRCRIPVLAWQGGRDLNHTRLLTPSSLYTSAADLALKISKIKEYTSVEENYRKSLEFGRNEVVEKFERIFIKSMLQR